MRSLYMLANHLRAQGYEIGDTDWRAWRGWSWLKARTPEGALVIYRNRTW